MFDSDLILMDGTIVATTTTDTPAISLTRDATTGAAVIDLGDGGTPASGLTAVLMCSELAVGAAAYTLTAYLQASDTVDMTGTTTGIDRLGNFGVAVASTGVIIGSETPCVSTVRFATSKRYIRINATVSNDFGYLKCYLEPYTFKTL
uniref:Uncharacterized protein n=1 Tax=viral metagenome TaxID=1070528 RepID=A0A6M3XT27_9ZZZZ